MRRPFHSELDASHSRRIAPQPKRQSDPGEPEREEDTEDRRPDLSGHRRPPLYYALRTTGVSRSDAILVQLDVVIPWLERRLATGAHA